MYFKNKLIGRVIEECTSVINELMLNNKVNIDNDNTITYVFIRLFSVLLLVGIVFFACFLILSGLKIKNCLKINIFTTLIKMVMKSVKIKNQS